MLIIASAKHNTQGEQLEALLTFDYEGGFISDFP